MCMCRIARDAGTLASLCNGVNKQPYTPGVVLCIPVLSWQSWTACALSVAMLLTSPVLCLPSEWISGTAFGYGVVLAETAQQAA